MGLTNTHILTYTHTQITHTMSVAEAATLGTAIANRKIMSPQHTQAQKTHTQPWYFSYKHAQWDQTNAYTYTLTHTAHTVGLQRRNPH